MPTARELLEQADALMRRNRARDGLPPAPAAPAAVAEDDIPELTELALPGPDGDSEPPRRQALARELATPLSENYPHPSDAAQAIALDDIPELTEVVEEIEAPSMLGVAGDFELGEPSVWMEPGHGELSMLGPWTPANDLPADDWAHGLVSAESDAAVRREDSPGIVAVGVLHLVPELLDEALVEALPTDVTMLPDVPVMTRDHVTAGRAASLPPSAAPVHDATVHDATAHDATAHDATAHDATAHDATAHDATAHDAAQREDRAADATDGDRSQGDVAADAEDEDEDADADAVSAVAANDPEQPGATPGAAAAVVAAWPGPDAVAAIDPAAPGHVAVAAVGPALPTAVDETRHWETLAEEIRMQVLQRLDIFTDTGLQDQLAARLQPIVDRASADLVTSINQHVGQLLRAYVAEAIEREIEKWRAGDR